MYFRIANRIRPKNWFRLIIALNTNENLELRKRYPLPIPSVTGPQQNPPHPQIEHQAITGSGSDIRPLQPSSILKAVPSRRGSSRQNPSWLSPTRFRFDEQTYCWPRCPLNRGATRMTQMTQMTVFRGHRCSLRCLRTKQGWRGRRWWPVRC